jgi:hypothetical protein
LGDLPEPSKVRGAIGVEFIDENGGGSGVRPRKQKKITEMNRSGTTIKDFID